MATNLRRVNRGYGIDNALQDLAPQPVVSQRAPTTRDLAPIGTQWIDQPNNAVYSLTSIVANAATWTTAPSSGATTLASLIVTGVSDLQGNTTVGGTLDVTGLSTVADLDVTGTLTFTGDLDLTSAALIDLTSTLNADPAILLHANGGTAEVVRLHSDQGTAVNSIELLSDVGGITLQATGNATDDAINLNANAGGVDINAALQVNISSSENVADAIVINSSAGGMDLTAAGAAGEDIDITCTAGSVNITGGEGAGDAVVISASSGTGGIDLDAGGGGISLVTTFGPINLTGTENAADAIYLRANGGTGETIRLHSDQGTGVGSVTLESDVGGISLIATGLATDDAINLSAPAGGVDVDSALQLSLVSSENAADAIVINASAGGIDMTAAGGLGEDMDLVCTAGSVNITGGEAVADAVTIQSSNAAGGIDISAGTGDLDIDCTGDINIISTNDVAGAILIEADGGTSETIVIHADQGTAIGSIELESDVGGVLVTTGALAATTGLHIAQGAATVAIQVGSGAPVHNAPKGSIYSRTDGSSTSTRLYVATDAVGTWTNVTTAA